MDKTTFLAKANEFKREAVDLDGIGQVFVREVSAADAAEYAKKIKSANGDELAVSAWLVVRVLCDERGTFILTDADIPALKAMPLRVLKAITDKSESLSGLKEDDRKNASAN